MSNPDRSGFDAGPVYSQLVNQLHSLGPRSPRATTNFVGDTLAFTKLVKLLAFNGRTVKEHVLTGGAFNKSKTLVRDLLNLSFCHFSL